MGSHRIHLRGPWDFVFQQTSEGGLKGDVQSGTVTMPKEWKALFGEIPGVAHFRRHFHQPTNLESHERVFVLVPAIRGIGHIRLNHRPMGEFDSNGTSIEFDVSDFLNAFNELDIEIAFDPRTEPLLSGGLYEPVALEIRWSEDA